MAAGRRLVGIKAFGLELSVGKHNLSMAKWRNMTLPLLIFDEADTLDWAL